jgi:hypothetical protein
MSVEVYKVIHLIGLALIMFGLGGLTFHALGGGEKKHDGRRGMMMTHGFGLLLALVGGFGLHARMKLQWEPWLFIKVGVWLSLGLATLLLYRSKALNKATGFIIVALVGVAVAAVQFKYLLR